MSIIQIRLNPVIEEPLTNLSLTNLTEGVDLIVTDFVAPSSAKSGDEINLSWTVANQGTEEATTYWGDRVVLSTDTVYDYSDIYVADGYHFNPLAPDATYNTNVTAVLPNPPTAGDYYLLVATDYSNNQLETDETNNIKYLPITVTLPTRDLIISSIIAPSTVKVGELVNLSWTVTNQGTDTTTLGWYDAVYLSTDEIFNADDDIFFDIGIGQTLESGQSYTTTVSKDFSNVPALGEYYLFFITDIYQYEAEINEDNNIKAVPITITAPDVDLVVTSIIAPSTAVIGVPFNISWTVTNQGTEATTIPYWEDIAYYSYDDIFRSDIYLTQVNISDTQGLPLAPGESYTVDASVELSDSLGGGDYYLFVEADSLNYQHETDNLNNFASAVITGIKSPVDLELTSVNAPSSAKAGEEIELSWTVTNIGTEATDVLSWSDNVYLNVGNDTISLGDILVSVPVTDTIEPPLAPGESYTVNTTVKLPDTITPGPYYFDSYYLRFYTDYGNEQAESGIFNNDQSLPITITPDVDLVVTSATAPPTIFSGEPIELSWIVTNQGTDITDSSWSDGVYLSTDETFDASDSYVTEVYTGDYLPLEPGESYTTSNPYSSSIIADAGDYYLLFVTDINNAQLETDEDNNVKAIPITVTTPDVDLVTSDVSTPTTAEAGSVINLSWTVTNQGTDATTVPYWYDYVLLSTDTVYDFIFSPNPDISIALYSPSDLPLAPGEGYTVNQAVTIPTYVAPGNYYLLFGNNAYNFQPDTNPENDVVVVPFTVIEEPNGVDLFVSDASAPYRAGAGKEIALSWTVTNEGTDTTIAPNWYDYVLLSTDTVVDFSSPNPDFTITFEQVSELDGQLPLATYESYKINQTGTIPDSVQPGDYYLLFVTNIDDAQDETDQNNNVLAVPFTVLPTTNVDLVTSDVSTPTVATAGSEIDLSWTVTNQGNDATTVPYWYDYVLLSTDTVYDFFFSPNPDIDIALYSPSYLPLAPGDGYVTNQSGTIPNYVAPGQYYLLFGNDSYDSQEDIDPGNDVVVVPFSVVQSTMPGSTNSDSLTGTDESELIEALEGRDKIMANGGDDVIVGGTGGDIITGGAGADRFIYRILQDIGDTITDFTINEDKIDISELLDSFSYQGSNPVTDGYLRWIQGSNGTSVQVDTDGLTGNGIFRSFIFLENVAADNLTLSDFFI